MAKKNQGFGYTTTPPPRICRNGDCKRRFTPSIVNGKQPFCDFCRSANKKKKGISK